MAGQVWGATYTVCASGCTGTAIQTVMNDTDLAPGDILEIQADTPGGTKTYTETLTPEADDVGSAGNHITMQARSGDIIIIDGTGNSYAWIQVASRNYWTWKNLTFRNGSTYVFRLQGGIGFHFENIIMDEGVRGLYLTTNAHTDVQIDGLTTSNMTTDYGIRVQTDCISCSWNDITANANKASGARIEYAGALTGPFVIDGFEMSSNEANGIQIQPSSGSQDYSALTIRNGVLADNWGHSFYVNSASGGIISDILTHDSYNPGTEEYHHAFSFVTADSWDITRVTAYDGDNIFVIQDGSDNNIFKYCLGYGVQLATGFALWKFHPEKQLIRHL